MPLYEKSNGLDGWVSVTSDQWKDPWHYGKYWNHKKYINAYGQQLFVMDE